MVYGNRLESDDWQRSRGFESHHFRLELIFYLYRRSMLNAKRAVIASFLIYLSSFIAGLLIATVAGINPSESTDVPPLMWYAGALTAVLATAIGSLWYFQSPKLQPSLKHGLQFGLVAVILGFVMDIVLILPTAGVGGEPLALLIDYYSQPLFWVTLVLVIAAASGVGYWLERKKMMIRL